MNNEIFLIGIDPGTNCGIAVYRKGDRQFDRIETVKIHRAMELVLDLHGKTGVFVRVEDARLRQWFGRSDRERLQGAGSIKRDCSIKL